ncbi:hypothetical protein EI555_010893 [Monodon monoceros]|uniref:Uncharacterized protein n=1 Tax=Monodon monoceros TaxID=40151 RepID=A0A4U1EC95_MONMO|nr:hypothetical protein EI555_010893 [Monodon monoceros]
MVEEEDEDEGELELDIEDEEEDEYQSEEGDEEAEEEDKNGQEGAGVVAGHGAPAALFKSLLRDVVHCLLQPRHYN